jgi:hypothetical protein
VEELVEVEVRGAVDIFEMGWLVDLDDCLGGCDWLGW